MRENGKELGLQIAAVARMPGQVRVLVEAIAAERRHFMRIPKSEIETALHLWVVS